MHWADDTIKEFGHQIGVDNLRFGDDGGLVLSFEKDGTLCLERREQDVLMYLIQGQDGQGQDRFDSDILLRALEQCHPRRSGDLAAGAALCKDGQGGNNLVFITRLTQNLFTLPGVEQTLISLNRLQRRSAGED